MRAFLVALLLLAVPATALADRKPTKAEKTAVIKAAKASKLTDLVDCFKTKDIRVSTKGPWAAAVLRPCDENSADAVAGVFRKKAGGKFVLKALGNGYVGCDLVSKKVAKDLDLFC